MNLALNSGYVCGERRAGGKSNGRAYPVTTKYRMWSFSLVIMPTYSEHKMHEIEQCSDYILYYHNGKGMTGVVQFSKGTSQKELERLYPEFVFNKLTSNEMVTRIGWIHRNKVQHTEHGTFRRRMVVKPLEPETVRQYSYFYDPETGVVTVAERRNGVTDLTGIKGQQVGFDTKLDSIVAIEPENEGSQPDVGKTETEIVESDTEIDEPNNT